MQVIAPLCLFLTLTASQVLASPESEIDYLLSFVVASGCSFIRNGKVYSAEIAAKHLDYKYNRVKPLILSAEKFIKEIASASSISNKPYQVQCGKERRQAREWLHDALHDFRTVQGESKGQYRQ